MTVSDILVSVVIPAYNGNQYIEQAIASVLNQSYPHFEIVVSDDASHDDTCAIVKQFQDPRIRLIENRTNQGLVRNLNHGIVESHGDLICWLNQDDIFYADKIERQVQAMRSHPTIGACFCEKTDIDEQGRIQNRLNPTTVRLSEDDHLIQLFGGCYLSATTVMMRREAYNRLGGFDPAYGIAFDYDMWFKLKKAYRFKIIQQPLLKFRHHANNLSSEKNEPQIASECASIIRKNLHTYQIEDIYPFLKEIKEPEKKRVETSACLLSLADLIWRQKKWNFLLVEDILQLIDRALGLNPILIDAYRLGLKVGRHGAASDIHHPYTFKEEAIVGIYSRLVKQLESAFYGGHQQMMTDIIEKMYAMCPVNGDPYYQIARLCLKTGDRASARSYCAGAIQLNNCHGEAKKLWAVLHAENDPMERCMRMGHGYQFSSTTLLK
jgi:glycosyltransferase involved in cell wall biosynthesis